MCDPKDETNNRFGKQLHFLFGISEINTSNSIWKHVDPKKVTRRLEMRFLPRRIIWGAEIKSTSSFFVRASIPSFVPIESRKKVSIRDFNFLMCEIVKRNQSKYILE